MWGENISTSLSSCRFGMNSGSSIYFPATLEKYSLHQKILWPTDSTLAIARIVYAGIFDRYPNLKLIASHLGGMILCYLDRLNWREGKTACKEEPETYFQKIYYDTAGPIRAPF